MTIALDRERVAAALPAYEVGDELGRGGFGVVFAGKHRQLGRAVAIKQLVLPAGGDPSMRDRFVAEARLLATLDHPHIVPIYDYVETEGLCLLVMEHLGGGSVWKRFASAGFTMQAACAVVMATCAVLHFAHQRSILHRDVKPENMMFSSEGAIKVVDFGIAKVIGGAQTLATRAGEVLGTPAYMAPEQVTGKAPSAATDVYAAGIVLYELVCGRQPFPPQDNPLALLYQHAYEAPIPLQDAAPGVPDAIASVAMSAIATAPEDRHPTAEAFAVALAEAGAAEWGPGWLSGTEMRLFAPQITAAAERPSQRAAAPPPPGQRRETVVAPPPGKAQPPTAAAEPVPAPRAPAPPPVPVKPAEPARPPRAPPAMEQVELVPVKKVVKRPPFPRAQVATALGLVALSIVMALLGLGSPGRDGDVPRATITVAGADPAAGGEVRVDLSKPVPVTGSLPSAARGADHVRLTFSVAGIPLGDATAPLRVASGRFTGAVDARGLRFLVASAVTGDVEMLRAGRPLAHQRFSARADRAFVSIPGVVAIGLPLFVLAYAESILRAIRRRRAHVTGLLGMVVVGAAAGVAAVVLVWVALAQEPTRAGLIVSGALGAAGGTAGALAAIQIRRRRRPVRRVVRAAA